MLPLTIGAAYCCVGVDVEAGVVELFGGAACVFERGLLCTRAGGWLDGPKACGEVVADRSSSTWPGLLLLGSPVGAGVSLAG